MALGTVTFADQKPVTVFLDGTQLEFDVQPVLESGRTLVPMRVIFESLGATVDWDNDTRTAIAVKDDVTIKITIDDMKMYKNDEVIELDVPARLIDTRTLVPARAVSEGMGAKVDWDNENWRVDITTAEDPAATPEKKEKYNFDELSEADRKKLDEAYDGIRYSYEQYNLPSFVFDEAAKKSLENKDSYIGQLVDYAWWSTVTDAILSIQMDSESEYSMDGIDDEEDVMRGYMSLVTELNYMYNNFFEMGYVESEGGNVIFLLTFDEAVPSMTLPCKYIGITLDKDNNIRYFTAETDLMTQDKYFFCEVFEEGGRGSIGLISMDQKSFLSEIDNQIK